MRASLQSDMTAGPGRGRQRGLFRRLYRRRRDSRRATEQMGRCCRLGAWARASSTRSRLKMTLLNVRPRMAPATRREPGCGFWTWRQELFKMRALSAEYPFAPRMEGASVLTSRRTHGSPPWMSSMGRLRRTRRACWRVVLESIFFFFRALLVSTVLLSVLLCGRRAGLLVPCCGVFPCRFVLSYKARTVLCLFNLASLPFIIPDDEACHWKQQSNILSLCAT